MKKLPETDAIFENVWAQNQAADDNPRSLRISIDSKATVKLGNLRNGKARTLAAKQAADHDTAWQGGLVPFGILNTQTDQLETGGVWLAIVSGKTLLPVSFSALSCTTKKTTLCTLPRQAGVSAAHTGDGHWLNPAHLAGG